MSRYDHLDRDALLRLLERRDAERQLGLVWEREELDPETAINDDYVALDLDADLSHGSAPWRNLIIEGDNHDALRALRMSHAGKIRERGHSDFMHLRKRDEKLHTDGRFSVDRLRW